MEKNNLGRLETFCDGVFAIAITLLILEIKVPSLDNIHAPGDVTRALIEEWPSLFAFLLSFITLFIAWTNHHNFFKQINKVSSVFIYANGFLMLTIIFFPYPTAVLGHFLDTPFSATPIIFYCFANVIQAVAWTLMAVAANYPRSLARDDAHVIIVRKSIRSIGLYPVVMAIITGVAFWMPLTALVIITILWIFILITGIIITPIKD